MNRKTNSPYIPELKQRGFSGGTTVIPIVHKNSGCSYHRIYLPYRKLGYETVNEVVKFDSGSLYVFNREFPNVQVKDAVQLGLNWIVDLDDYWRLDVTHPLYLEYKKNDVETRFVGFIKYAKAVMVTNINLYNKIKPINPNVIIVPNTLPFDEDQFKITRPANTGKFIYAGSHSHLEDIKLISDQINSLNNIEFYLAGYNHNNEWSKMMLAEFDNAKTERNRPLNSYMNIYTDKSVSLVPLVGTEFDTCKSNLKILEAGCKGLHVIASKTYPYYNYLDRDYIDFCENKYEWYEKIRYCMNNPSYVEDKALSLQEHVINHYNMEEANSIRKQIIDSLK